MIEQIEINCFSDQARMVSVFKLACPGCEMIGSLKVFRKPTERLPLFFASCVCGYDTQKVCPDNFKSAKELEFYFRAMAVLNGTVQLKNRGEILVVNV